MSTAEKSKLLLVYPCFVCNERGTERGVFNTGQKVIAHMKSAHDLTLSPRPKNARRPQNDAYIYIAEPKEPHDEKQFACPSCWHYTPDITELHAHLYNEHNMVYTEKSKKKEPLEYNGTRYQKRIVNDIYNQLHTIFTKFQDILKQ